VAAGLAFFLSGASALVYQVVWQRLLALGSGVGIYSVAMIVAAFMLGLGLGSHAGGVLSLRLGPRDALRAFAVVELLVGAFGAASGFLFYDLLYQRAAWLFAPAWRAGLVHFLSLALPTTLMGMSLPLLVRGLVRSVAAAGRTVSVYYGLNVLGAAAGALLGPWVLIRYLGLRSALLVAAAGSVLAGVLALWARAETGARTAAARAEPPPAPAPGALRGWAALYALSGFTAIALEILWFRLLEVGIKSTAFTFGTLLCVYLVGSAAGSLWGGTLGGRIARPRRTFLLSQCLLLAYAAGAVVALARLPPSLPGFAWFFDYWGGRLGLPLDGSPSWAEILRLYVVFPLALFGPPTVLMGVSFAALQRAVHDDPRTSGRKVGLLQAANIAGCVAGSLAAGLVLLRHLGTSGAFRALLVLGLVFPSIGLSGRRGRAPFAAAAATLVALALAFPSQEALWRRWHGLGPQTTALVGEDGTGVIALASSGDPQWHMWVNGRHHSTLPFGGIHTTLGALPALVHANPLEAAIIGLGSGDTAWAAGCRPTIRRVAIFEICAPERQLLERLNALTEVPKLPRFLADPRMSLRIADGRNALLLSDRRYDIIELDALFPRSPYAGTLFSVEFFSLCARRLKPGGLMCSWTPTPRTRASFLKAFPHVLEAFEGRVLLGSNEPLALDPQTWQARLLSEDVAGYLGAQRVPRLLRALSSVRVPAPADPPDGLNTDLHPRDEFARP
jgi:predicted membrane-bound spermidine synthase